jgi:tight adherence protein C
MILLTSAAASLSIFLFALWYLRSRNQAEVRVRSLGEQQRIVVQQHASFSERVAFPMVEGMVRTLMNVLPTSMVGRARKWLVAAGDTMPVTQFFTVVLLTSTLIPAAYLVLVIIATSGRPSALAIMPAVALAVLGLVVPFMFLRRAAKNRQTKIWKAMPNALDLMTTCVEAGLSLDFALQRVAERYKGPLSDEIQRSLREMALGKTRRESLVDMAERIGLPDFMTFVNSIVQAETLGTSVGQVLRVQAQQMRLRRRQRAEQIARQAPVKMVFPLVLFLMPSLFIVTIGPVMLNVIDTFKNH